jgi:hypothetical protein
MTFCLILLNFLPPEAGDNAPVTSRARRTTPLIVVLRHGRAGPGLKKTDPSGRQSPPKSQPRPPTTDPTSTGNPPVA